MPKDINGYRFYTASEVCQEADISRPTLFRWLKRGVLNQLHRDRRGWRMFTDDDLQKIRLEAGRIDIQDMT
jgi:DNA-binding transcriptional MerR regulator